MLKSSQETRALQKMYIQSNRTAFIQKHLQRDYEEIKVKKQVFKNKA